LLRNKDQQ